MKKTTPITTIFLDIGGVLLTNGWDSPARKFAAENFGLDFDEMSERHHLTFDTYEVGKVSLEEYLNRVVFYKKRLFTRDRFKKFMLAQSRPFPETIEFMCDLKKCCDLKIAVVSNEGRELTEYRIKKFKLDCFVDFFICSSFVHIRKPDADIYRLALDIAQVPARNVVYIEDRPLFVQVAQSLGIRGIRHTDYNSTRSRLASLGLSPKE